VCKPTESDCIKVSETSVSDLTDTDTGKQKLKENTIFETFTPNESSPKTVFYLLFSLFLKSVTLSRLSLVVKALLERLFITYETGEKVDNNYLSCAVSSHELLKRLKTHAGIRMAKLGSEQVRGLLLGIRMESY